MLRRLALLHPFFIAVTPILFLGAVNIDQVSIETLFIPAGIALAATLLVYIAIWRVCRDARRAAAVTTLALFLFFAYGHVYQAILGAGWFARRQTIDWCVGSLSVALFGLLATYLWRTKRTLEMLTQFLSLTAIVSFAISTRQIIHEYKHYHEPRAEEALRIASERFQSATKETNAEDRIPPVDYDDATLPDIYYIILDGYGRADMLKEIYDYDNSEFIAHLRSKGFYVADKSHSNYPMTFLSLASSLNMRYINEDTKRIGRKQRNRFPIYDLIHDNAVGRYLQAKGYRYVHICSNWSGTESSRIADVTYGNSHPFLQKEFVSVLLRTTMLHRLAPCVAYTHLYALNKLEEIPEIKGPTFTFAHLVLPHNPYVFDRHGNIREDIPLALQFDVEGKTGGWQNHEGYVEQLAFVNARMREVIDAILKRSPNPPVIIIQADHGTATRKREGIAAAKQPDFIRERMPILNAYYVPQSCRRMLYADISPVNSFRLLFNGLFHDDFERLSDRQFFAWYRWPYKLRDVTKLFYAEDVMQTASRSRKTFSVGQ